MMLEFHRITEEEKEIIGKWKYDGEYSLYDSISYEEQKKLAFVLKVSQSCRPHILAKAFSIIWLQSE